MPFSNKFSVQKVEKILHIFVERSFTGILQQDLIQTRKGWASGVKN